MKSIFSSSRRMLVAFAFFFSHVALFQQGIFAEAATLGAEGFTVPNLSCFTLVNKDDMTAAESDLSGIAYDPETGHFFAVNNGDAKVYELDSTYTKIQEWALTTLGTGIEDPEGIAAMGSRKFAITDENPALVRTMTLNADGTISNIVVASDGLTTAASNNKGFEGVAYLKNSETFIVAQEQTPVAIHSVNVATKAVTTLTNTLRDDYGWQSLGAVTKSGDATDEIFVVVKAPVEHRGIHRMTITGATATKNEKYAGHICDMSQPEGLTFYKGTDGDVYMLVVGEKVEARLFKADSTCTAAAGATVVTGTDLTCPAVDNSVPLCELTMEDRAKGVECLNTRCDTGVDDNEKVCVFTSDAATSSSCSRDECHAKCTSSAFSAGTPLAGSTCTHYAWDTIEAECYLFTECTVQNWDNEYTQYTMKDLTCERPLSTDFPNGCNDRTCSTADNVNAAAPAAVADAATCETQCKNYVGAFTCKYYTYNPTSQACHFFSTCSGEADSTGSNLYTLVDPTCERDYNANGMTGCPNRICDDSVTTSAVVCDQGAGTTCTLDECAKKCASYDGFGNAVQSQNWCTYFAYDTVDSECTLFKGCVGEKFDDDHTLYKQSYPQRSILRDLASGCTKSLALGGCPDARCDKDSNPFNKVCDKDNGNNGGIGGADAGGLCSQAQCEAYCVAGESDGGGYIASACTHWAYEPESSVEGRGECYVFSGCNNLLPDTYTTYAMATGCDLGYAAGGCENQRCAKATDASGADLYRKICDSDVTGAGGACTSVECEAQCRALTEITSSHWAFELAEQECYCFEGCESPGEDTYNVYKLDDICNKNYAKGGCPLTRCAKSPTNQHDKVCDADVTGDGGKCTEMQCMQKCAEYTGFVCTHWAFEEAEGECYVFDGCEAAHSDTYNTYLYDPQCQITKANGGCADVRCEKDSNPYVKTCDKDNVGIGSKGEIGLCSLSRCERFCTDNRIPGGAEVSAQLGAHCTHFAWEPDSGDLGECYIFSGCKDMSTDTYVTYLYESLEVAVATTASPGSTTTPMTKVLVIALTALFVALF